MNGKRKNGGRVVTRVEAGVITFEVAGAGEITLQVAKLSPAVLERAVLHGLVQRITDAAAMSRDPATGAPADPAARLAAMSRLVAHYESGTEEWGLFRAVSVWQALANVSFDGDVAEARRVVGRRAERDGVAVGIVLENLRGATAVTAELARMRGGPTGDEALAGLLEEG